MQPFKAFRIFNENNVISARFTTLDIDDTSAGEVIIKSAYSDINYKDALAATGKGKILKSFPLNGGIDVAGTVVQSTNTALQVGDAVLVTGCGLGENRDGGYAEYVRVPAEFVVPLPVGLSLRTAMAIGTAGFTAALAIQRMQDNGQTPDKGTILVTGATGGVGSLAISMLAKLGYHVTALTSKTEQADYLHQLGASEILFSQQVDYGTRPLEKGLWAGAIDNLGGQTLTWLTRTLKPRGNIALIGLASSIDVNTTVMPFILRGINLLGINCDEIPRALRLQLWQRLATDLHPQQLDKIITHEVDFTQLQTVFNEYIENRMTGRTLIKIY
ncbi:YhdH/YhfP family quinone oxidoreductase [Beggiatoa leptomitoformis]|uniref:Acryloyl-CoA reductase n=1 Tax=Beggiatoa leptomitoformis TaxID=288004 RepID=A0A2N9YBK5_9GAMM|nr:YhdH/YhfP family quinone oxidoreductase [Beggiatoa leptomitoformis]ALG66796.1 acryloyl-CoA reductase [Beggiatoa leptomitoformis]AUI67857.1 acryloyl-CoA reductase [Beggiatoa leptomitoformis]